MNNTSSPTGHLPLHDTSATGAKYAATSSYTSMDSCQSALLKELGELFWELMDHTRSKCWKKKVLTAFMIISSILVFCDLLFFGNILHWFHQYALWMKLHILAGTFLFLLLMILSTLIMIPPAILTFVCGYVYSEVSGVRMGVASATLVSFVGLTIGSTLAFVRARYMMRDLILLFSKRYKVVRAADRAIAHHGFRVFFLLRLCPIIPFNGLNYIGGITAVTMEEYVFALIGILPVTLLSVLAGATTGHMVENRGVYTREQYTVYLTLIITGAVFALAALTMIVYVARKELQKELLAEQIQEDALKAVGGEPMPRPPSFAGASACSSSVREEQPSATGASTNSSSYHRHDDDRDAELLEDMRVKLFEDDEEWFWLFP